MDSSSRAARIRPDTAYGLPRHDVPRKDGFICVTASAARQSMHSEVMDCRASLSMNSFVIANAVKQSMTPDCMDCRASLAVTGTLFKGRVRYLAWYGWLAMTALLKGMIDDFCP